MCIFFFIVGGPTHPTLLCNNRDEYFVKPTARGSFFLDNREVSLESFPNDVNVRYIPKDLEGGGTWISFRQLHHASRTLRFACVLNLDSSAVVAFLTSLRSRGTLVRDFMTEDISAYDFAARVYAHRSEYRPFNLIVSDGIGGAYYVSSSVQQSTGPQQLALDKLYGITNGPLGEAWEKTERGEALFAEILVNERLNSLYSELTSQSQSNAHRLIEDKSSISVGFRRIHHETQPSEMVTSSLESLTPSHPTLDNFLRDCLAVMTDDTPCADPEFGNDYKALTQLASIYAIPTIIHHRHPHEPLQPDNLRCYTVSEELKITGDVNMANVFGTRTVTLLLHYSGLYQRHKEAAHSSATGSAGNEKTGVFVLLEDDIICKPVDLADIGGCDPWKLQQIHDLHVFNSLSS